MQREQEMEFVAVGGVCLTGELDYLVYPSTIRFW